MRWSIVCVMGLFATNIVVLELRETPKPPVLAVGVPAGKLPPDALHVSEMQRLKWLHTAWRAGYQPRGCAHRDPVAILDADVDPSPGREHVIGNRQYGVAMYGESGDLIAYMHPVGCAEPNDGDQSLSLSFDHRLIVTTYDGGFADRTYTAHIAERDGDLLVEKLALVVGYSSHDKETATKLYFTGNTVEAKTHGRERRDGEWHAVDDHCTYDLVTRSSSCRKRAAGQTSAPE